MQVIDLADYNYKIVKEKKSSYNLFIIGAESGITASNIAIELRSSQFSTSLNTLTTIGKMAVTGRTVLIYSGPKKTELDDKGHLVGGRNAGIYYQVEKSESDLSFTDVKDPYVTYVNGSNFINFGYQYDATNPVNDTNLKASYPTVCYVPNGEEKTITITSNGTTEIEPTNTDSNNRWMKSVKVNVNVDQTFYVPDGMKFATSTLDPQVICNYDYSNVTDASNLFANTNIYAYSDEPFNDINFDLPTTTTLSGLFKNVTFAEPSESGGGISFSVTSPSVENISSAFEGIKATTEVDIFSVTLTLNKNYNVSDASNLFASSGVTDVNIICTSNKINNWSNAFKGCSNIQSIHLETDIVADLDLSDCTLLTHDSIVGVIAKLVSGMGKTLTLGETNLAKLSDEEKAVATNKGWVLN